MSAILEPPRMCAACGAVIRPDAFFCGRCGQATADRPRPEPEMLSLWARFLPAVRLWVILIVLIGALGLAVRFADDSTLAIGLAADLVAATAVGLACWVDRKRLRPLLGGLSLVRLREVPLALGFLGGFMWAYFTVLEGLGVPSVQLLDGYGTGGWPLWMAFVSYSLLPASYEELAFRGFIQSRLEEVGDPREALVIQAAMFACLHLSPAVFVSHFVMGVVFGVLRHRSRSLYPSALAHGLWNAIIVWMEATERGLL